MPPQTFLIVAAYNEADRIGATLAALALAFPGAPVWVADDGSSDATGEIARTAGARVVRCERVIGKGEAVTDAARAALLQRRPATARQSPCSCSATATSARRRASWARCATPSRTGGPRWPSPRSERGWEAGWASRVGFARWAIRRRCGLRTTAPISGQRALSRAALEDVLPFAHGFGMELGMTIDAVRAGHRVLELELDLAHRATGRTPAGFLHRGRQLADFVRVYLLRRHWRAGSRA